MLRQIFQIQCFDGTCVTVELDGEVFRLVILRGDVCVKAQMSEAQVLALSDNLKHLTKVN